MNAIPLLLVGGAALLLMGKKKNGAAASSAPKCGDATYAETYKGVPLYVSKKIEGHVTPRFFAFICVAGKAMAIAQDDKSFAAALVKARQMVDQGKAEGAL